MAGYCCGTPGNRRHIITHLFYMDDLKLYVSGETSNKRLALSSSSLLLSGWSSGWTKDVWKMERLSNLSMGTSLNIWMLESPTYLAVWQRHTQLGDTMKEASCRKYKHLLLQTWSSELSGTNNIGATNALSYQFCCKVMYWPRWLLCLNWVCWLRWF